MFVAIGLRPRNGAAIVGRHNHQRVIQFSCVLQQFQHLAEIVLETCDLEGVIKHVAPNLGRVGQKRRHFSVCKLLSFLQTRSLHVSAMRIATAKPKAERFVLGALGEKILKRSGVSLALVSSAELRAGGVMVPTKLLIVARPPALARMANEVTGLGQASWKRLVLGIEVTGMGAGMLDLPGVETRQERRA